MFCAVTLLALLATVQGRAVNISNTWVLPEEGFPVFYRYFRDRISWYEADAVCQFHHANLVTVDTTAQYDAVRAYLKELDISSAVWVGLIRSNPDGDFTWTDYRGMSGDGYWSSAPDGRTAPLCAAANPAADYRWEARACGGPTVASFICELAVPQWALGDEGCMIRALPALTILYLPESAAVQLTADCGLAGVKRIECTGNVKREDLLQELSCVEEDDMSTSLALISISTSPASTDFLYTDEDTTKEITTEENITTEHENDMNQLINTIGTSIPQVFNLTSEKLTKIQNPNKVVISKSINLDVIHNENLQSNFIPKIVNQDNILSIEQLEKLEDEKLMQHKMLHEEIARLGNLDNIFTQPTDHFVPPLVMAKAKISDDMTVLSLAEKHAQQIAEQQLPKQGLQYEKTDIPNIKYLKKLVPQRSVSETTEIPLISSTWYIKPIPTENKDKLKNNLPKKYNEKYDTKYKIFKTLDYKSGVAHITNNYTQDLLSSKEVESTTINMMTHDTVLDKSDEDPDIDLTVLIKEPPTRIDNELIFTNYSGDVSNFENMNESSIVHETLNEFPKTVTLSSVTLQENSTTNQKYENFTFNHEIIKITMIADTNESNTPIVFDVTTKIPVFQNNNLSIQHNVNSDGTQKPLNMSTFINNDHAEISTKIFATPNGMGNYTDVAKITNNFISKARLDVMQKNYSDNHNNNPEGENVTSATPIATHVNITEESSDLNYATTANIVDVKNKTDVLNTTRLHEELQKNINETLELDDFQSPLLSAANEPLHRPNRSRRPQTSQNRNKFNPFRILG